MIKLICESTQKSRNVMYMFVSQLVSQLAKNVKESQEKVREGKKE